MIGSNVLFLLNAIETIFLRANSTLEFSHSLDPKRTCALSRPAGWRDTPNVESCSPTSCTGRSHMSSFIKSLGS